MTLTGPNGEARLTRQEARILTLLRATPGIVISHAALQGGMESHGADRGLVLRVVICHLRAKLAATGIGQIESVHARGYLFQPPLPASLTAAVEAVFA